MPFSRVAVAGIMSCILAEPAMAARTGDFGGLPICSRLNAMPRGYRPSECNSRSPLSGECRFFLTAKGMRTEYLIENGIVLEKRVSLRAGPRSANPFGLLRGESRANTAGKVRASTGLATRYWDDAEDAGAGYLQSTEVNCSRTKSYTISVWFRNGRAEAVSVSTLPAM